MRRRYDPKPSAAPELEVASLSNRRRIPHPSMPSAIYPLYIGYQICHIANSGERNGLMGTSLKHQNVASIGVVPKIMRDLLSLSTQFQFLEGRRVLWTSLLTPSTRKIYLHSASINELSILQICAQRCRQQRCLDSEIHISKKILFISAFKNSPSVQAQFALSFFTTLLRPDANAALALLGLFGSFYLKRDPIRLYFLFLCMCASSNA